MPLSIAGGQKGVSWLIIELSSNLRHLFGNHQKITADKEADLMLLG
jgi:hypothetical protein